MQIQSASMNITAQRFRDAIDFVVEALAPNTNKDASLLLDNYSVVTVEEFEPEVLTVVLKHSSRSHFDKKDIDKITNSFDSNLNEIQKLFPSGINFQKLVPQSYVQI